MLLSGLANALRVPTEAKAVSNQWINDDIKPLPPHRRTWDRLAFMSFWALNQICLSNWQLGASLVAIGLSVWQAVIAIILGKAITAAVAIANGYAGAEWHIGFPVYSRVIWGIYGQYVAILQRILLSLVWFAVQSWTGGLCVQNILAAIFPSYQNMPNKFPASAHMDTKQFIGWCIFNVLMVPMLWFPPEKVKWLVLWMNIISAITLVCMMIWALSAAGGAGPLLSAPAKVQTSTELGWSIILGTTTVVGSIAVGLTNQMDYSRFARRPGDQVFGQWFSILLFGTIMPFFGCLVSSATQGIYGEPIWNPPNLVQKWLDTEYNAKTRAAAFFAGFGLVVCQLAINAIDNAFSTGFDTAGLFPNYINIRRGAYLGLLLSIAMCPWELLSSAGTFISVLSAYSVFLGPMVAIQISEYWLIRGRRIKLSDLYHKRKEGIYYYNHGLNWRAFVSWIVGFGTQLPGFAHAINKKVKVAEGWNRLYYMAYVLGFAISFVVHLLLNRFFPVPGAGVMDPVDYYGTFSLEEATKLGIEPYDGRREGDVFVDGVEVVGDSDSGTGKAGPVPTEKALA